MPLTCALEKRDKYLAMVPGTVLNAIGYFFLADVSDLITLAIAMVAAPPGAEAALCSSCPQRF
jgi:hypothetical protein